MPWALSRHGWYAHFFCEALVQLGTERLGVHPTPTAVRRRENPHTGDAQCLYIISSNRGHHKKILNTNSHIWFTKFLPIKHNTWKVNIYNAVFHVLISAVRHGPISEALLWPVPIDGILVWSVEYMGSFILSAGTFILLNHLIDQIKSIKNQMKPTEQIQTLSLQRNMVPFFSRSFTLTIFPTWIPSPFNHKR